MSSSQQMLAVYALFATRNKSLPSGRAAEWAKKLDKLDLLAVQGACGKLGSEMSSTAPTLAQILALIPKTQSVPRAWWARDGQWGGDWSGSSTDHMQLVLSEMELHHRPCRNFECKHDHKGCSNWRVNEFRRLVVDRGVQTEMFPD